MSEEKKKQHKDDKFSNVLKADSITLEDGTEYEKGDELPDLEEHDYHRLGHSQHEAGFEAALYTHEEVEEQKASKEEQEKARQKEREELEKATAEQLKERDKANEKSAQESSKKSSKKSEE